MAHKEFSIQVPTPCHEKWESMRPVDGGAYCEACSKVVVDFTRLSDAELIKVFTQKRSGELCGRFLNSQLERSYKTTEKESQRSYRLAKLIFIALLSVRLPFYGQDPQHTPKYKVVKEEKKNPPHAALKAIKVVKGKVTNKDTRKGIVVKVQLYANGYTNTVFNEVVSDSNGHYEIVLPDSSLARFFKLTFVNENYGERSCVVDKFRPTPILNLRMVPQYVVEVTTTQVIRDINEIQVGVSVRDQEYTTSGPAENYQMDVIHVNLWYKIKRGFRRLFRIKRY